MAITPSYGATVSLTVTNLHSLADASAWNSDKIDNATDTAVWVDVMVTIVTTTTAGSATGYLDVYLSGSTDEGTNFAGSPDGTEGAYSPSPSLAAQLRNMIRLGRINAPANETTARTYEKWFQIPPWLVPKDYQIVIVNQTGTAIASSGNLVELEKNSIASS